MKDHSLIERIKNKDSEQALKEIYQNYRNEFFHWAISKHACTIEDAKDIFQQTVVIFYENIANGKLVTFTSQVKTYLFSIGKNKILELMRQRGKSKLHYDEKGYLNDDFWYGELDDEYEVTLKNVERCLEELGDPCKNILRQYYYHKKTMTEISKILDYKNSDTVKNLKYKCLQRLRQMFKS